MHDVVPLSTGSMRITGVVVTLVNFSGSGLFNSQSPCTKDDIGVMMAAKVG